MKNLLLTALLCFATTLTVAEDISYVKDCPDGGTREVVGSYDSVSGDFKLVTEIKDCARHNEVTNGNHIAEGNFTISNSIFEPMATVAATITSDMTIVSEQDSAEYKCTKTISGTYDMTSNTLDGSIKSDCNNTGKVMIPILDLFSGEEIDDENLDENTDENTDEIENNEENQNNNVNFDYPDVEEIKDQISQCINPDMIVPNNQGNNDQQPWDEENTDENPWNQYPSNQGNNGQQPGDEENTDENPWNQYPSNQGNNGQQPGDEENTNENPWNQGENEDDEEQGGFTPNITGIGINL